MVDGIATTISRIHGNTANGTIVNNDLTETPCYIVKEGKYFAHGKTLAEANASLQDKLFDEMPAEKRIAAFWECHKKGVKYPNKDFFEWHLNFFEHDDVCCLVEGNKSHPKVSFADNLDMDKKPSFGDTQHRLLSLTSRAIA